MLIRKILLATSFLVASAIPTMADSPYGVCPTTQSGIDTLVKTADNISFSRIEAAGFTLHTTQVGQEPAYEALLRKVSAEQDAFVKGCLAASTLTKTEIDPSSLISVEVRTVDLMQRHCGPSYRDPDQQSGGNTWPGAIHSGACYSVPSGMTNAVIEVTSKVDDLRIDSITLNNGNCRDPIKPANLPFNFKMGDVTTVGCSNNVIKIVIETDQGIITLTK